MAWSVIGGQVSDAFKVMHQFLKPPGIDSRAVHGAFAVGAILYEMVVGYPPFFSDDAVTTCQKIVNWRKYLKYPEGVRLPCCLASYLWVTSQGVTNASVQHTIHPVVKNLIECLLCDVDERLGSHGGAEEIKVPP